MIAFLRRNQSPPREPLACQLARELGRLKRILFVEDSDILRDILGKVALAYRVEFVGVPSVEAAREAFASDEPFAAAILDYRLTNGNGIELYREISEQHPETRVIFLTGFDDADLRRKVAAIGPAVVYSKDSLAEPRFMEQLFAQFGIKKRGTGTVFGTPQTA